MPYRRLPNTDKARQKALLKAYQMGKEMPPFKLAFSQSTYQKIVSFLPGFEKKILYQKSALAKQIERNKEHLVLMKKAKLYISHFIQVVNMAIQRGELSPSILEYYQLKGFNRKLPTLNSEEDVIRWGKCIIDGETDRVKKGMSPITNPTIAVVKVRFEKFIESYHNQKNLRQSNCRTLKELSKQDRMLMRSLSMSGMKLKRPSRTFLMISGAKEPSNMGWFMYTGNLNWQNSHCSSPPIPD